MEDQKLKVRVDYDSFRSISFTEFTLVKEQLINPGGDGYIVGYVNQKCFENLQCRHGLTHVHVLPGKKTQQQY